MTCEAVQDQLTELALAREPDPLASLSEESQSHARDCDDCGRHVTFLGALATSLESDLVLPPTPAVVFETRARAARALRAREEPKGLARELVGTLGLALLALPVVVLHGWVVVRGATTLLAPLLPDALFAWIGIAYFGSLALAVGLLYGSLPLAVAYARRQRLSRGSGLGLEPA